MSVSALCSPTGSSVSKTSFLSYSLTKNVCSRCRQGFLEDELTFLVEGTRWHSHCFSCAQCFCPLNDTVYYQFEGRLYCEHDFHVLYAPVCYTCGHFVIGRVKKALNRSYHARCFLCEECGVTLEDGVWHYDGRAMCKECKDKMPKESKYTCVQCRQSVTEEDLLRKGHDFYHAYHLDCAECKATLTTTARELRGRWLCRRCFDGHCESCSGCRRVIDPGEERSVFALGKHWHVEHFVCNVCGKPFLGREHFEREGKAFCKEDFLQKHGDWCFVCNRGLTGESVRLFGKGWCSSCYRCATCDAHLSHKDRVLEWDQRPMCRRCFKHKSFKKAYSDK